MDKQGHLCEMVSEKRADVQKAQTKNAQYYRYDKREKWPLHGLSENVRRTTISAQSKTLDAAHFSAKTEREG